MKKKLALFGLALTTALSACAFASCGDEGGDTPPASTTCHVWFYCGQCSTDNTETEVNKGDKLEPLVLTHDGYHLVGWKDGNGNLWNFETDTVKGDYLTLTAVWEPDDDIPYNINVHVQKESTRGKAELNEEDYEYYQGDDFVYHYEDGVNGEELSLAELAESAPSTVPGLSGYVLNVSNSTLVRTNTWGGDTDPTTYNFYDFYYDLIAE